MQGQILFWAAAAVIGLATFAVVLSPLLSGRARAARRASYDMQIYRDQLREIDTDRARGVLSAAEAAATRLEVSRRLLGAAEAEAAEAETTTAPRRLTRRVVPVLAAAVLAAAAGLYATLGAPGLRDQPLDLRLARLAEERANRPGQAEVEALVAAREAAPPPQPPEDAALIDRLRGVLAGKPDDLEGHRLLVRSLGSLGRWTEARAAQEQVLAILGDAAGPQDAVALAELMILATQGYVSPEAEALLSGALEQAPGNAPARYYSGLALLQGGRADLAYELWARLLEEGPPQAPWVQAIDAQIDEVAGLAGLPPPDRAAAGPSRTEIEAAGQMSEAERGAMIEGMVAQLGARLAEDGGPPEDWARLIRALGVLGRTGEAATAWDEARGAFAADPGALDLLAAAARDGGIAN